MKLKAYRYTLLTFLFIAAGLDIAFFGLTIYHFVTIGSKIMDGIIYILCLVLLLAFNVLEIVNTFFSFKDGSRFVKFLIYDDNNDISNGTLVVASLMGMLSLAALIYFSILFSGAELLFFDLDRPMLYIIFAFFFLVFINTTALLSFPFFGKEDQAMKIKVKKKRGSNL